MAQAMLTQSQDELEFSRSNRGGKIVHYKRYEYRYHRSNVAKTKKHFKCRFFHDNECPGAIVLDQNDKLKNYT